MSYILKIKNIPQAVVYIKYMPYICDKKAYLLDTYNLKYNRDENAKN